MSKSDFDITLNKLNHCKTLEQTINVIWKTFMGKKCSTKCGKDLKIAVLNAPCYGFGDVIFAQKLTKYLKEWYGSTIHIFTTLPDAHIQLGEDPNNLIKTVGTMKSTQCRTFNTLNFGGYEDDQYDLYFVAPLVANFSPNIKSIVKKFKYANNTNVFFFSEYNAPIRENYAFPTGVGGKRMGLLLVKPPKIAKKMAILKNPYALIYIASEDHIPRANYCYMEFMKMVTKKYSTKYKKLDIVVPEWITTNLIDGTYKKLIKNVSKYYPHIVLKTKQNIQHVTDKHTKTLTIRGDVLPVDNKTMFSLMKHSIKDILLTGDQSITDALSCCSTKNIFYQIAGWKENFGRELAKELPNKYLNKKTTSCGTIAAIKYISNYQNFVNKWDFRKLARPKLDAIVLGANAIRKNNKYEELTQLILKARSINSLKKKIKKLY